VPSQLVAGAASAKPKPEPEPSCDGLVEAVLAHACVALVILADGLSNRAPIPDPDQACMRVKIDKPETSWTSVLHWRREVQGCGQICSELDY